MIMVRKNWHHVLKLSLAMVVFLLFFGAVPFAQVMPAQAASAGTTEFGAGANPTGNPIGGGVGYSHITDPSEAYRVVSTRSQLLAALSSATSGQIIYVADTAEIDLSGSQDIIVPAGITLASGRGRNGSLGGLIYTNTMTYHYSSFLRPQDHVTFSGIRLRGPDGAVGSNGADPTVWGIRCSSHHGLVVENCEIYDWTFAGVAIYTDGLTDPQSPDRGYVHHNYIHNNQRSGYGYGVDVGMASALIEANLFDYGRHFIAGNRDYPVTNYEARYNVFGSHCTNAMVDCHGGNDSQDWGNPNPPNAACPAGGTLLIHHNTFQSATQASVGIRGVPATICKVYNNWTYWPERYSTTTFKQRLENLGLTPYVRMQVYDNWFGTTPPPTSTSNYAPAAPSTSTTDNATATPSTPTTDNATATPSTPTTDNATAAPSTSTSDNATATPSTSTTNSAPATPSTSTSNNAPAMPYRPSGTTVGVTNRLYTYWVMTTDPERDTLRYTIDWGDGGTSTTILKNSGTTGSASHSWARAGTYAVRVRATDSHGAVSAWSPALTVVIR
jgi:hypothetical protein